MSFTTTTITSHDSGTAVELHAPPQRLEQQLKDLQGVEYACVRPVDEDALLEEVTLVQVRGGDLLDIAHALSESDLGPFALHHSP